MLKIYTTLDLVHNLLEIPPLCMAQKPLAPCDNDVPVDVVAVLPDRAVGNSPLEKQLRVVVEANWVGLHGNTELA